MSVFSSREFTTNVWPVKSTENIPVEVLSRMDTVGNVPSTPPQLLDCQQRVNTEINFFFFVSRPHNCNLRTLFFLTVSPSSATPLLAHPGHSCLFTCVITFYKLFTTSLIPAIEQCRDSFLAAPFWLSVSPQLEARVRYWVQSCLPCQRSKVRFLSSRPSVKDLFTRHVVRQG